MSNFSDYIKTENSSNANNSNDAKKANKKYTQEELEDMINNYSQYDNNKLMSEFLRLTLEKKRKGELRLEELEKIKNTLYPMLNEEQKSKLNQILEMVKNVE